jgi:hypothetical protein
MLALVYPEGTEERSKRTNDVEPVVCTFKLTPLPKLLLGCAEETYASSLGVIWDQPEMAATATIAKAKMLRPYLPAQICARVLVAVGMIAPDRVVSRNFARTPPRVNPGDLSHFSPISLFVNWPIISHLDLSLAL